jgi:hypothetical protein
MENSTNTIIFVIVRVIIYGAVLVGVSQVIFLDSFEQVDFDTAHKYGEYSYTEWSQVVMLIMIIGLFFWSTKLDKDKQAASIAVAGFFTMSLIREFDMYLDLVFDGLWQIIALVTLLITILLVYRQKAFFKASVIYFFNTTAFGFIAAGFLTTFVFSRLYGRGTFWKQVMEDGYMRTVKNASEESIELLGYAIIFFGAIEYFRHLLKDKVEH